MRIKKKKLLALLIIFSLSILFVVVKKYSLASKIRGKLFQGDGIILPAKRDDLISPGPGRTFSYDDSVGDYLEPYELDDDFNTMYFVSSINGNDSADGSEKTPFKTITHALTKAQGGDIIRVQDGDYISEGVIQITHNAKDPIRIIAQNSRGATLQNVNFVQAKNVELSGFIVTAPQTLPATWVDMPRVVVDDPSIVIDFIDRLDWEAGRKDLVEQKYSTWINLINWDQTAQPTIIINNSSRITLTDNEISLGQAGVSLRNESSNVLIDSNYFHHNLDAISGLTSGGRGAKYSFSNSQISNNTVEQTFREGIALRRGAKNNLVFNNTVSYSGTSHIVTYNAGEGNIIKANNISYGGYYSAGMKAPGSSGISVHSAGKNTIVDSNIISYQVDETGSDGNGIIVDFNKNGTFIVNNVIYNNQGTGITSTESANVTALHNTVAFNGLDAVRKRNASGFRANTGENPGMLIANNIFYKNKNGGIYFGNGNVEASKYIGHNVVVVNEGTPVAGNGNTRADLYMTFEEFLQGTGFGKGSTSTNPGFINEDAYDFRLRNESPVIGIGSPEYTVEYDLSQKLRDSKKVTPGAYLPIF